MRRLLAVSSAIVVGWVSREVFDTVVRMNDIVRAGIDELEEYLLSYAEEGEEL